MMMEERIASDQNGNPVVVDDNGATDIVTWHAMYREFRRGDPEETGSRSLAIKSGNGMMH